MKEFIKSLTAMVFVKQANGTYDVKKYSHNIRDNAHYIGKFCNDMKRKFTSAEYINFYHKKDGVFKERIYLE